ncbi:MAG TPA: response regulator transcription factor [Aggregatilineales bacterium]|nr:response regulator transcription factor [Aggregatilineales bacterium]
MTNSIRIVLADDHTVLRSGLRLLLNNQPHLEVVAEASTGIQALALVSEYQPNVLLLDLNMPEADGLSIIPQVRQTAPNTKILILTMHEDGNYLQQALQAGASGYLLKKVADIELLMAIEAVMRGELYVHSAMTQYLIKPPTPPTPDIDPWKSLSEREFDVLKRVALGYTNTEIAEELFLSQKTVETYRARGMEKLDIQTRAQLVKSAMAHGHLDE